MEINLDTNPRFSSSTTSSISTLLSTHRRIQLVYPNRDPLVDSNTNYNEPIKNNAETRMIF